jgi:diguanylate cyclase (GGDEF)-like protein
MTDLQELLDQAWHEIYIDSHRAGEIGQRIAEATQSDPASAMHAYGLFHVAFAEVRIGDAGRAREANNRARLAFQECNDARGLLLCDEVDAIGLRRESNYVDAMKVHLAIAARDDVMREDVDIYISHNSRAITHELMGHADDALNYYYRSLEVAERLRSPGPRITAMSNLGGYHHQLFNFEDALHFGEQAFAAVQEVNDPTGLAVSGVELLEVYFALNQFQKAHEMAIFLKDKLSSEGTDVLSHISAPLALGFVGAKDYASAQVLLNRGPSQLIADGDGIAFWAWVQALCYQGQGEFARARELVERTLSERADSDHYDLPYTMMRLYEVAADCSEALDDTAAALAYTKRSRALYEKLVLLGAKARQVALQVRHEVLEAKQAQLAAEHERERLEKLNAALQAQIAETNLLHAQLRELAVRDSLTGLNNRRYLFEAAPSALELSRRRNAPLCVAMLDLDHFKRVNDEHGHQLGDEVLQRFSQLLSERLRRSDIICRYGGEEFVVVMPDVQAHEASIILTSLQGAFARVKVQSVKGELYGLCFSAGVAQFAVDGFSFESLLQVADKCLYHAKNSGRARIDLATGLKPDARQA